MSHFTSCGEDHDSWEGSWRRVGCVTMERKWKDTASRPLRGTMAREAPREVVLALWAKRTYCLATFSRP